MAKTTVKPPVKAPLKPEVRQRPATTGTVPPLKKAASPAQHQSQKADNGLILSYQALQQLLGWFGLALPVTLLAYAAFAVQGLQPSISDFYYTAMGDVLVGILAAIGVFLLCYRGYEKLPGQWLSDRQVSFTAGLAAIAVALFPAHRLGQPPCSLSDVACITFGWSVHPEWLHYGAATIFFACLAVFCLVLFTRSDRTPQGSIIWTPRNIFYTSCGGLIVLSIVAMAPYVMGDPQTRALLASYHYLFWWETLGILAFAASWLRKGKAQESVARVVKKLARKS